MEVADILMEYSAPDPFDDAGRTRPVLRPTISQYRRYAFRFASELVHSGLAPHEITGLSLILDPVMVERGSAPDALSHREQDHEHDEGGGCLSARPGPGRGTRPTHRRSSPNSREGGDHGPAGDDARTGID